MKTYTQVNDVVELCIPPQLEPELMKIFAYEMRHGYIRTLRDGRKHYRFRVQHDKAMRLLNASDNVNLFETELFLNQYLS